MNTLIVLAPKWVESEIVSSKPTKGGFGLTV